MTDADVKAAITMARKNELHATHAGMGVVGVKIQGGHQVVGLRCDCGVGLTVTLPQEAAPAAVVPAPTGRVTATSEAETPHPVVVRRKGGGQ